MSESDYPDIDRDHVEGETVLLGTISYPGGGYYGELSLTNQALIDFINTDSNEGVTLLIEPQVAEADEDFFLHIRSSEGVGSDTGDIAPTLEFPNIDAPEVDTPVVSTNEVYLSETSGDVEIGNGYVRAVISKSDGRCTDLRMEGGNNLLLNGGKLYMDLYWKDSFSGSTEYTSFSDGTYSLVEATTNRAHFMVVSEMGSFEVELHYVLQVGDSGIHCYVVYRHGVGDAETYLEQARMVLRCDKNVFTRAFASEDKTGQMISPSLLAGATEIMDATLQLPMDSSYTNVTGTTDDGYPVYTKYDWADCMETHKAHGLSGATNGLWMISGSEEFMNGGPTKGELLVHGTSTTPLMIETFHASHFIGTDSSVHIAENEEWEKVYGPYFIYLNGGTGDLWQDALERADEEKAAWPLSWMDETAYPVERGAVSGRLFVEGVAASNALMVLAQPGSDWQVQGHDYIFWARADAEGNFSISKVRPGAYSLYAVVPGTFGEMEFIDVTVGAGATNDLGRLSWTPPRREEILWQVGTPDRSTAEFRFGDQMRQFGLWWRYIEEQGADALNYIIGSSIPSDWYYAQMVAAMDDGSFLSPEWNVVFDLDSVPTSTCELILDLAGSMSGTLYLSVNGASIGSLSLDNDAGIYRSATQIARHSQRRVTFDASKLNAGTNRLTLQLNGHSDWSGDKRVSPTAGVMYDALRLEAGTEIEESITQDYSGLQIQEQPEDQWGIIGETIQFSVMASGSPSYQWMKDGADLSGETNASLTIVNVQPEDQGVYSVQVFNELYSVVSSGATLTVGVLAIQAEDEENTYGGDVALESNNEGFNGSAFANFPTDGGYLQFNNVDGGTGGPADLTIRFALGNTARTGNIVVNGTASSIEFPSTGGWSIWNSMTLSVTLGAGTTNTIRFESTGADLANIDEITVVPTVVQSSPPFVDCAVSNGVVCLGWPLANMGWTLQYTTNLTATNWVDVVPSSVTNVFEYSSGAIPGTSAFFRLKAP